MILKLFYRLWVKSGSKVNMMNQDRPILVLHQVLQKFWLNFYTLLPSDDTSDETHGAEVGHRGRTQKNKLHISRISTERVLVQPGR